MIMARRSATLVAVLMVLSLSACSSLWSRVNVGNLQADVEALFEQTGIQVSVQNCDMVGTTRTGYCRFNDQDGLVEAIIQGFSLEPVLFENATIAFIDAELEAGCGSFPSILEGSEGKLFLVSGRPQRLRLSNGSAFEYMLLLHSNSSGEACLQVSYAYG
jgi:hypothetical protein